MSNNNTTIVVKEPTALQKEVCNQAVVNDLVTPYDIIDYTYSNARLGEIKSGKLKTKNSADNQISNTLTTNAENMGVCVPNLRIRKLTPKECWRLMGFDDEDFTKAEKVCSNSQLYKQAGNSIVVNVLEAIFKELFVPKQTRSEWLNSLLNT
jgi:site-specific DNA-cytosine methylase